MTSFRYKNVLKLSISELLGIVMEKLIIWKKDCLMRILKIQYKPTSYFWIKPNRQIFKLLISQNKCHVIFFLKSFHLLFSEQKFLQAVLIYLDYLSTKFLSNTICPVVDCVYSSLFSGKVEFLLKILRSSEKLLFWILKITCFLYEEKCQHKKMCFEESSILSTWYVWDPRELKIVKYSKADFILGHPVSLIPFYPSL